MARNWTAAQSAAMNEQNRTLLVSAAAGSGKTAVLTERIIRSLTDPEHPADISRILVVTFTRAAAGELRHRISSALSSALALDPGNGHLTRQLMLLGGAHISTIDSFYLDLVRAHFQAAGFPPSFRMADDTELIPLRREAMNDAVDAMYAEHPDFSLISDIFCDIRNEDSLAETLIIIAERLNKYPESIDILLRSAREIEEGADAPLDTAFGGIWMDTVREMAQNGVSLFTAALDALSAEGEQEKLSKKFSPLYTEIAERCRNLLTAVDKKEYDTVCGLLASPFSVGLSGGRVPPMSEEFSDLRALCDAFREKWKKTAPVLGVISATEIKETAAESASVLRLLHAVLTRYTEAYHEAKSTREIAEFSDVSRAAYRLLVEKSGAPTPLARELSAAYDAIYIDEYQDVDAMQDATFRAIATERNRFMVGDIKQSIYRFRGAQPAVFADYRKRFPLLEHAAQDAPEATVFMSDCFRCDENVIRFSNAVSGFLFSRSAKSIDYTHDDDLVFSKVPPSPAYRSEKCQVLLLDKKPLKEREEGEEVESSVLEAKMVAAEIARLIKEEKKADGTPITAADIAVLMRSTSLSAPLAKALAAYGIPTNDTSRRSFFENPEVLCMYSLLATIDNPFRDIYLAATLRSPFFGFTLENLVTIRSAGDGSLSLYESLCRAATTDVGNAELSKKITDFLTRLTTYRDKAQSLSVDKLLRYLYRDTAVLAFSGYEKDENGTAVRRGNLNRLYEYARTFEAGGFKGLYQFIRYVDNIMQNGTKMPAPEGDPNAVALITIHHSKGLEYPVCFLVGTASRFNEDDRKPALLSDERLGCATRLCNAGPFSRTNTFFRQAISLEIRRQNREEEMRVLYVAMTRARERLYVTGTPLYGAEKALDKALLAGHPKAGFLATDGHCYMDWILAALQRPDAEEFAEIRVVPEADLLTAEKAEIPRNGIGKENKATATASAAAELTDVFAERFSYVYPFAHLTRLPAKLSVSRLSPVALDVYDSDNALSALPPTEEEAELLLHTFDRTPLFGGGKVPTAAEKGTATHELLQFCDFESAVKNGVEAELERLIGARYLSPATRGAVRMDELKRFFQSDFFASLARAQDICRETRFNIFLPAADFTEDAAFKAQLKDERLLVQGVIDLFYTDESGKLILCDYKTDRLTPAELRDPSAAARMLSARHGKQLSYYAMALARICGKTPEKILIYSLPLGEAVEAILPDFFPKG
ncbi:MAG: helicase-exonuclease AddAB subunit AddA [Clostridia bacterium]|nr:helicase-exonuclease AddAB subunit AddA [Clostridia bacterium]